MTGLDSSSAYRFTLGDRVRAALVRLLVRGFFRRLEVTGREYIPLDRGGILVAWHPNGLIDPTVLTASFPGRVIFGAKHVLFDWPIFGRVLRAFGAVPIYRARDSAHLSDQDRRAANEKSLQELAERISSGAYAALFPEGVSHDEPYLAPLRTGVARLYFQVRAAQPPGRPPPAIIPVGLHYDEKQLFRSQALVWYYPPLELPPELDQPVDPDDEQASRQRARQLTDLIEQALTEAVHPTEDWTTHRLINRARKLIRAERARRAGVDYDRPSMEETILGFARVQHAYYERLLSHPKEAAALRERVVEYDEDLTALGLDDHELDRNPRIRGFWFLALTALQFVFVMILLPPLLLLGYLFNAPPALLVYAVTRRLGGKQSDRATQKLILGAVAFPVTWLGVILLGAVMHGWIAARFPVPDVPVLSGVLLAVLSVVGAAHVLRYQNVARQAFKNLRVRFRRARLGSVIEATLKERAEIFDELMRLGEGLKLPGGLSDTGELVRESTD